MRRSLLILCCLAALMLALAGCGGSTKTKTVTATIAGPSAAKVALSVSAPGCGLEDMALQCAQHPTVSRYHPASGQPPRLPRALLYGIDQAWSKFSAQGAFALGARFAAGYYSYDSSKDWSAGLVSSYRAQGIQVVGVWETTADRALGGEPAGASDARQALADATADGTGNLPIYFAVDFDESPAQAGTVANYFRGASSVLGVGRTGAYGGYWTVSRLAGLVAYVWQTTAWSGGLVCSCANLYQYAYPGAYDWDMALTPNYGQASTPAPPNPKPPHPTPAPPSNQAQAFNLGYNDAWTAKRLWPNQRASYQWGAGAGGRGWRP